jgi:hypothetical protein
VAARFLFIFIINFYHFTKIYINIFTKLYLHCHLNVGRDHRFKWLVSVVHLTKIIMSLYDLEWR